MTFSWVKVTLLPTEPGAAVVQAGLTVTGHALVRALEDADVSSGCGEKKEKKRGWRRVVSDV